MLYIMQGVPGSGKSTVAKMIATATGAVICSTDDFFMCDGVYWFRPEMLSEFHSQNLLLAKKLMDEGKDVIVDNTNIKIVHCRPYVQYATEKGIPVVFVRVDGRFRNSHGVPDSVVERMRREMEILNIESVLGVANNSK